MISSLRLKNYRNLNKEILLKKANLLIAPNGSGKSNLIESIYLSTMGRSFRPVSGLDEYIGPSGDFGKVSLQYKNDSLEMIVSGTTSVKRRYLWNNKTAGINKLIGRVPVILFAPHNVNLVAEDPATRRNDLDDFLSILSDEYSQTLVRYKKVLKNRNAVLKHIREHQADTFQLKYWSSELAKLAGIINSHRETFIGEVLPFIETSAAKIYRDASPEFQVNYLANSAVPGEDYKASLEQKFEDNQQKEIIVGSTLYGPHKDDYALIYMGRNLRFLGSRGEQRLAVLIWKLAQHEYLLNKTGENAILLIDDLMSELDHHHRGTVAEVLLEDNYQFILASAESSDVPDILIEKSEIISLN